MALIAALFTMVFAISAHGTLGPRVAIDMTAVSHALTELSRPVGGLHCGEDSDSGVISTLWRQFLGAGDTIQERLSSMHCEDLSAEHPPPWFSLLPQAARYPASEFSRYRWEAETLPRLTEAWTPVCTPLRMTHMELAAGLLPDPFFHATLATDNERVNLGCDTPRITEPSLPLAAGIEGEGDVYSASGRAQIEREAVSARTRATNACCGRADTECRRLMAAVSIRWCGADDSACASTGAEVTVDMTGMRLERVDPRFVAVTMWLSPNVFTSGRPLAPYLLQHEYGHACSIVHRQLGVLWAETVEARGAFRALTPRGTNCGLNDAARMVWGRLFQSLRLNEETTQCLMHEAEAGPPADCAPSWSSICPLQRLEESFADAVALVAHGEGLDQTEYRRLMVHQCSGIRGERHPRGASVVTCLMRTPWYRERLLRDMGCATGF